MVANYLSQCSNVVEKFHKGSPCFLLIAYWTYVYKVLQRVPLIAHILTQRFDVDEARVRKHISLQPTHFQRHNVGLISLFQRMNCFSYPCYVLMHIVCLAVSITILHLSDMVCGEMLQCRLLVAVIVIWMLVTSQGKSVLLVTAVDMPSRIFVSKILNKIIFSFLIIVGKKWFDGNVGSQPVEC